MTDYLSVFGIGWMVDFLLIMAARQLYPGCSTWIRAGLAAMLGGGYCALSMLPWLDPAWTGVFSVLGAVVTAFAAFGLSGREAGRWVVFLLLRLTLGSLTQPVGSLRPWTLLLASGLLLVLCSLGLPDAGGSLIPVELNYGTKRIRITALRDTGNTLRDPVTGRPVLVLGADAAQKLTGLSPQQLRTPVDSISVMPGLRLIPYRAICGSGLLLALRVQELRIGDWCGSGLVAFAPEVLSAEGKFQALTGGML